MNRQLATVIIAPMTTKMHHYPSRIGVKFAKRSGWVALDQIRTVDTRRLVRRLGRLDARAITAIKTVIQEMLVD